MRVCEFVLIRFPSFKFILHHLIIHLLPLQICSCIVNSCTLRRGEAEGSLISFTNALISLFAKRLGPYTVVNLTGAAKQT